MKTGSSAKSVFVRERREKDKEKIFRLFFCVLRVLRGRLISRIDDSNRAPLEQPT